MSTWQALARAFRPTQFTEVVGQEVVVQTLSNALKTGRVGHAYLFSGLRGTGKTTLARLLAKALNCEKGKGQSACGTCSTCKQVQSGSCLDVIEIDGACSRSIDDVRQITETVGYAPAQGNYKIILIDEVHMLTKEAFNALLKTLEEPPAHVKFIFATTEPQKVPDTIKSRCQHFHLKRLSTEAIGAKLTHVASFLKRTIEPAALALIARRGEGSLRDAESMLDQLLTAIDGPITADQAADYFGLAPDRLLAAFDTAFDESNIPYAYTLIQELETAGIDMGLFTQQLLVHLRTHLERALLGHKTPYSPLHLSIALEQLLQAEEALKHSFSPALRLTSTLLKLLGLKKQLTLEELTTRLEALESRLQSRQALSKTKAETLMQFAAVELEGTLKRGNGIQ